MLINKTDHFGSFKYYIQNRKRPLIKRFKWLFIYAVYWHLHRSKHPIGNHFINELWYKYINRQEIYEKE